VHLPTNFKWIVEFAIPFLVVLISDVISGQYLLKYSAGIDCLVVLVSADFDAVIEYDDLRQRINPTFREDYLSVFAVLLIMSLLFMVVSCLTQRKLEIWKNEQRTEAVAKYPLLGMLASWVSIVALIPTHLFVLFGKG
jgi:hypothetical protein